MQKSKKVIVTGGAGFIGTEVVKVLLEKNYNVRVLDNLSKPGSKKEKEVEFIKVDLTDPVATKKAFKGGDVCINLAAKIGGVAYFNAYPATILSDNNKIYSSTFESAVANNFERMIYISSSMVYESTSIFASKEKDVQTIPLPLTSYGFSKLVGEQYCKSFFEEFGLKYSICRPFNAYGINEHPSSKVGYSHVIPDLMKKILSGQYPLEILGDGKQIRCFTHVHDLAEGIVTVMESKNTVNKAFNIANPDPITVLELAKLLWKLFDVKKPFKAKFKKGYSRDVKKRIPDIAQIKAKTSWRPKISLEDGLSEIVEFVKKNKGVL